MEGTRGGGGGRERGQNVFFKRSVFVSFWLVAFYLS